MTKLYMNQVPSSTLNKVKSSCISIARGNWCWTPVSNKYLDISFISSS
jgi:hypothetical protein